MAKKNIATFLGPQPGISTIGNHAYAYSGQIQASDTPVQHLLFTTGNTYLVGTIDCLGPVKADDIGSGTISVFLITFNGTEISTVKVESEVEDQPSNSSISLIIPPRTEVKVTVDSTAGTTGLLTSCNITGRIYNV